jgi:hypothetical protein
MGTVADQVSLPQAPLHWCGLAPKCVLKHASARANLSNFFVHRAHFSLVGEAPIVDPAALGAMTEEDATAFDVSERRLCVSEDIDGLEEDVPG